MPITQEQLSHAEGRQHAAGRDAGQSVRLVAGPGTGKSSTIEERVRWLIDTGVSPDAITAISFTRAASFDLRGRIHGYCLTRGQPDGADVRVSTLHSLALRTLRLAGALEAYPAEPLVLDDWELRHIFDAEFGEAAGIGRITRREQIRRDHEALWSTGSHNPPNIVPPDPPITKDERRRFAAFHRPRTQLYACVLPGEIIRHCVERLEAGTLDLEDLLGFRQLIVDEFQDLNPMDLRFVRALADAGASIFAAGDDDQSLYSFRFAAPAGIQQFTTEYPGAHDHSLDACFRCTPEVLGAATRLIEANAAPARIPKNLFSLYEDAEPPIEGALVCARYRTGRSEAEAIATSCLRLIDAGMNPRSILVLLSNQRAQGPDLFRALDAEEVPYEPPREAAFRDESVGRLVLTTCRLVGNPHDYVAHRTLLGLKRGVGVRACNGIATAAINANLNYRDLFYEPLPDGVFSTREDRALAGARDVCAEIAEWSADDALEDRKEDLDRLIRQVLGPDVDGAPWEDYVEDLPGGMTLEELRVLLLLEKDEQRENHLIDISRRLDVDLPENLFPPKVRIMSMHGAKGLSSQIVFIPGLEEEILPGPRRRRYPGLVLEAARMLYVSITRARLMAVLTYAERRFVNGQNTPQTASRFTADLGGRFQLQTGGVSTESAERIVEFSKLL